VRSPAIGVAVALGIAAVAVIALRRDGGGSDVSGPGTDAVTLAARPVGLGGTRSATVRWIVAAGGAVPELNQVQIEQDVGLVAEVLAAFGPGRVLFGAGAGSPSVQVLAPELERDAVLEALGDLFSPRGGRNARYRATTIPVDGEATARTVSAALEEGLAVEGAPLLVVLAGHGSRGETARDNTVDLWGQSSLSVGELGAMLERGRRGARVIATTCYAGGFAELAFAGADASAGEAAASRCGLFATTWDLEAAGCDPNPDRAAQEGYALHFFNALRGRDRDGRPVGRVLDLDGDGTISLLEAHTRVRMVSEAADVPTTTSERWLRAVAPETGPSSPVALPEDDALIEALERRLQPGPGEASVFVRLQRLEDRIEAMMRALEDAQAHEDATYRAAAASVLARWPVLDDPWHPDFVTTLTRDRASIAEHLETDEALITWRKARDHVDRRTHDVAELRRRAAWFERLARAHETRALAGRLHAVGGSAWEAYLELLACERTVVSSATRGVLHSSATR
jgi:hypothetical protein